MFTEDTRGKNSFSRSSRRAAHTLFTSLRAGGGGRMREHEPETRTRPLRAHRCPVVGATPKPKREPRPPANAEPFILSRRATKGNKI
ncbi:hypothetical protein NDU88_001327 [Pleurodeles waltl]|uniref:Uncharacterized protein n=1 Tax=Pleurodeles waltl TaxID=8319 RepID=A0AAV7UV09_PLEWA|nr:hypothetical protein NDU88_001327 [Pleurodeles waltl]